MESVPEGARAARAAWTTTPRRGRTSWVRRIPGHKLFLSSRADIYGGADAAREWYGWARPPKRLELVPGSEHGTDLLRPDNPLRRRVTSLIVRFLEFAMPPTS